MLDRRELMRRAGMAALATGLGDKAVSLFYEKRLHKEASDVWINRCRAQIGAVLAALETDRSARPSSYWFGEQIGHADIAVACVLRFILEVHAGLLPTVDYPALAGHAQRLEALPAFQKIQQAFIPPA